MAFSPDLSGCVEKAQDGSLVDSPTRTTEMSIKMAFYILK